MSLRSNPAPALLVVSAIFRDPGVLEAALPRISAVAGGTRPVGKLLPFDFTRYYAAEMGEPLFRRFLAASAPVSRDRLPDIKIGLEGIEREFAQDGRRTVNLDPGLVTPENFILATGKNFSHRIYLRDGVFADLTLVYRQGGYRPLPWTYPDYASAEVRSLLEDLRREHMNVSRRP